MLFHRDHMLSCRQFIGQFQPLYFFYRTLIFRALQLHQLLCATETIKLFDPHKRLFSIHIFAVTYTYIDPNTQLSLSNLPFDSRACLYTARNDHSAHPIWRCQCRQAAPNSARPVWRRDVSVRDGSAQRQVRCEPVRSKGSFNDAQIQCICLLKLYFLISYPIELGTNYKVLKSQSKNITYKTKSENSNIAE